MIIQKIKNMPVTVKASVSYTICSILQKCLSFITIPLFTRLLTTEQYGQLNIYTSWSAIISIFITLQLFGGSFQKAMVKYEDRRDEYISSIQGICIMLSSIFLFLIFLFRNFFEWIFELPLYLIVTMTIEIIATTSIAFWQGKKRYEFKYKSVVFLTLTCSIVSPVISYLLVINTPEKGYARIFGYALVNIIVGLFVFIFNIIKGKKLYNKEFWKYAISFNLPLIIYYLSQMIFNQSDKIMISHIEGTDKAGIYGVAYSLSIILLFVLNAINNSYVPWLYEKIKNNEQQENKEVANIIALIMATLLLAVIWLAPEIIRIIAGEAYKEAIWIVPPVAMSLLLQLYSQFSINIEFYYEQKKHLVYASILSATVNIILNFIFIPVLGYIVAGYTTFISYVLFALCNYIAMIKTLKEKKVENNFYNYKQLLLILFLFVVLGFVALIFYNNFILRFIILFLAVIVAVIKRKTVITNINKALKIK